MGVGVAERGRKGVRNEGRSTWGERGGEPGRRKAGKMEGILVSLVLSLA